uniref:Interleukin-6 n=1 Tax=Taeniopygia guttata TaxID=59729 RepID=H0YWY1_TAEGU
MKFARDCGCDRALAGRRRPPALRAALLLPPPLLLLLLVPRAAAAPLPSADSSGEAEPDEAAARRAALPDCLRLARLLHARAAQLQDEMCEKFTVCQNSMEMLLHNNLNLPKVTEEDGCLLAGFNEDKCLRKISSGLYTFQTYLKYIQETFISENQNVESLSYSTEHLAHAATQESLHTELKSTKDWTEKITIHLILRYFTSFMERTVRAVRYLKNTRSFSV